MALSSSSISESSSQTDTSSDDNSVPPPPPSTTPLLSMYRRELTSKRDEISQLREELGGIRQENLRLERALDMRRLNSYELDCDLQESIKKLEDRDRLRRMERRERKLRTDRRRRYSDRGGYFSTDPYSHLAKYEGHPVTKSSTSKSVDRSHSLHQTSTELELVKPLTYQKSSNVRGRWIQHAPQNTSYGGIFQPQRTKGKQVTQPRKEDLVTRKHPREKYVLSHQEATPDGSHLVTTLYKGNVNPTRSGGAQVRFTDTEVLHQYRSDTALSHGTSVEGQIVKPLSGLRMATVEDAKKNPTVPQTTPNRSPSRGKADKGLRMATLKDAKLTSKHTPGSHQVYRRATLGDAKLPTPSRYFRLV